MLKRFYYQISLLLIAGTIGLMACFGAVVYVELERQLALESKTTLQSEITEERETVESNHLAPREIIASLDMSDDKGLSLYALVHSHEGNYPSSNAPLSSTQVLQHAVNDRYVTFVDGTHHFAMMAAAIQTPTEPVQIVVYQSTEQQSDTLVHVRDLLFLVGLTGIGAAILIHLWIAKRALRPAQVAWNAHRDVMTEISHELQTPLATMSAIVNTHIEDEAVKEDLIREISEASTMVKDILYLSKINSKSLETSLQPIAVSDITEEVVERFTTLLAHVRVDLTGRAQPGLYVMSTSEMWTRLVSTLLKNVVDHSEPGTTAAWTLKSEGNSVKLRIENKTRHIRKHAKVKQDATRGFGMQIVRRIVEEMSGKIELCTNDEVVVTTVTVQSLKI